MTCISYNQNKKLCLVGSTQPITELISVNSESLIFNYRSSRNSKNRGCSSEWDFLRGIL